MDGLIASVNVAVLVPTGDPDATFTTSTSVGFSPLPAQFRLYGRRTAARTRRGCGSCLDLERPRPAQRHPRAHTDAVSTSKAATIQIGRRDAVSGSLRSMHNSLSNFN